MRNRKYEIPKRVFICEICYNGYINTKATHHCSICNAPLVLVSKVTEKTDGMLFPQTMTTYRCTNQECQEEKDRQVEKRQKMVKDKEEAIRLRVEKNMQAKAAR
jgi:hypothetical protein